MNKRAKTPWNRRESNNNNNNSNYGSQSIQKLNHINFKIGQSNGVCSPDSQPFISNSFENMIKNHDKQNEYIRIDKLS